uniref:Uncharacterized protein n=1 Tax=Meloidogyne enterolobii TaxID=390850 RepID=A0A6V7US97_MELEN|nr:unnamed protein product [Meloidogyne enterolobii]
MHEFCKSVKFKLFLPHYKNKLVCKHNKQKLQPFSKQVLRQCWNRNTTFIYINI